MKRRLEVDGTSQWTHHSTTLHDSFDVVVALPVDGEPTATVLVVEPLAMLLTTIEATRALTLETRGQFPPLAIVGISLSGSRSEVLHKRFRYFTPTRDDSYVSSGGFSPALGTGEAAAYFDAVIHELLPSVNEQVKTSNQLCLAGWSLSGLFALWAWTAHSELIENVIALSPSLWWNDEQLRGSDRSERGRAFVAVGSNEIAKIIEPARRWSVLASSQGHHVRHEVLEGEDHATTAIAALPRGLRYICQTGL